MYTDSDTFGVPIDFGAQWIHGGTPDNPIYNIAQSLHIDTEPTPWEDMYLPIPMHLKGTVPFVFFEILFYFIFYSFYICEIYFHNLRSILNLSFHHSIDGKTEIGDVTSQLGPSVVLPWLVTARDIVDNQLVEAGAKLIGM